MMKNPLLPCLSALLTAGCASYETPVVRPAPTCAVPAVLAGPCASPMAIAVRTTFADLLLIDQADRSGLTQCAATQRNLVRLLDACEASLAKYNASLDSRQADTAR